MKAEADDPGGVVRLFFFSGFGAFALIGLPFVLGRLASALSGSPTEDLSKAAIDLFINLGAAVAFGVLFKNELDQQGIRSRARAEGGLIARANVRMPDDSTAALSNLRFGRAEYPRIPLICIGPLDYLVEVLESSRPFADRITNVDFLVVPVLTSQGSSDPRADLAKLKEISKDMKYVANPAQPAQDWQDIRKLQMEQVKAQGLDASVGLLLLVKKNGRVGRRILGLPDWSSFTGQIESRTTMGLDTTRV